MYAGSPFFVVLAHSIGMSLCNREASVVRLSLCLSVCKLLHASRYFYHKHDSIATKLAHDGPQKSPHPGCAQGQGQDQRSCDTDTFLTTRKSLLLPQTWLDRHQTYTTWSPHGPASSMCSRSSQGQRSRDTGNSVMSRNVCYTVPSDVLSLHALTLRSTVALSFQYKCQTARCNVYIMEWATPSLMVWFAMQCLL